MRFCTFSCRPADLLVQWLFFKSKRFALDRSWLWLTNLWLCAVRIIVKLQKQHTACRFLKRLTKASWIDIYRRSWLNSKPGFFTYYSSVITRRDCALAYWESFGLRFTSLGNWRVIARRVVGLLTRRCRSAAPPKPVVNEVLFYNIWKPVNKLWW